MLTSYVECPREFKCYASHTHKVFSLADIVQFAYIYFMLLLLFYREEQITMLGHKLISPVGGVKGRTSTILRSVSNRRQESSSGPLVTLFWPSFLTLIGFVKLGTF